MKRNKMSVKEKIQSVVCILVIMIVLWVWITMLIQRFKCPKMTETELFLAIPSAFICDWRCE